MMTDTDGERIRALEVRLDHMSESLDRTALRVQEMHDLVMRAQGAKWVIVGFAAIGGAVGAKLSAMLGLWK